MCLCVHVCLQFAELGNLSIHLLLRNLRPAGTLFTYSLLYTCTAYIFTVC